MQKRSLLLRTGAVAAIVATAIGAFLLVRATTDNEPAVAAPESSPTPAGTTLPAPGEPTPTATFGPGPPPGEGTSMPGPDVTPEPGATPDITQPYWAIPWRNQDRMEPLLDGTLAGIRIGNGVDGPSRPCEATKGYAALEAAEDTAVDPTPDELPPGATITSGESRTCLGQAVSASLDINVPTDIGLRRFGGEISVFRSYRDPFASVAIAENRWEEAEVAGMTVALARPILPDLGLGTSAVVAYDGEVVTIIVGVGIELEDLLLVAYSVLGQ